MKRSWGRLSLCCSISRELLVFSFASPRTPKSELFLPSGSVKQRGDLPRRRLFLFPTLCRCKNQILKMEKEPKEQRTPPPGAAPLEPDFPLQWGGCKRLRCVKVRDDGSSAKSGGRRGIASRINRRIFSGGGKDFPSPPLHYHHAQFPLRVSGSAVSENQKSPSSPEKDDRCYTTRGSLAHGFEGENGASFGGGGGGGGGGVIGDERTSSALPRFFITLSNKEKEEDFMAMKGCKLPQRPKKRSKFIQKCILLVSPGAWLSDLSHERYVVREKKGSRKRRRGLKAMSMNSDSE